jgi:hypothetical protein
MTLKRIIMHWTAGNHWPNRVDLAAYHFVVDGDGKVHEGDMPPEANLTTKTPYAAHTRNLNTGSIGVSCAAMWDARESPFDWGRAPLTEAQIESMCMKVAELAHKYGIPITAQTVLTHAEVEGTLGVKQRWKWDYTVLPGMTKPQPARQIGDMLRARIRGHMKPRPVPKPPKPQARSFWQRLWSKL